MGGRERALVAFVILSLLMLLKLRHSLSPSPSLTKEPMASFRLVGPAATNVHPKSIPRILHQTWSSGNKVPEVVRPWVESWLKQHPGWQYWFWSDADMRSFVEARYPQYLKLYDSYPTQGYRNDAFRSATLSTNSHSLFLHSTGVNCMECSSYLYSYSFDFESMIINY